MNKAYFDNQYKELEQENIRLKNELQKLKQENTTNNGSQLVFSDLVDIDLIQLLINQFYELTNMPVRIIDEKRNIIVSSGKKENTDFFYINHPELTEPVDDKYPEQGEVYLCKSGCYLVKYDLTISGRYLASVYMGEFLYDDNTPDAEFIQQLAGQYNIDNASVLKAIQSVPVFSKKYMGLIRQVVITHSKMLIVQGNYSLDLLKSIQEQAIVTRELAEQEKKYKLLTENATDVIWTIGIDFKFAYVSPSIEKFSGYKQDDVFGLPIKKLLTFNSFKKIKAFIENHISTNGKKQPFDVPYMLELEGVHKNGNIIYFETTINVFRNNKKQIVGIQGISRDITKRKLAEAKEKKYLKSSNFLASAAMDFVNFPIDNDIYHYIGEKLLKLLNKNDVLLIYEIDDSGYGYLKYFSEKNNNESLTSKLKFSNISDYCNGKTMEVTNPEYKSKIIPNEILNELPEFINNGKTYTNCFPIRESVHGLMFVFTHSNAELDKQETMDAFVTQASIAINKRIAEEQAKSYIYHLETLYNTSKQLINPPVKNDIFQYITTIIQPLLPEPSFVIAASYDAHGRFLKIEDIKGLSKKEQNKISTIFEKKHVKDISIPLDKENNELLWNILSTNELQNIKNFPAYLNGPVEKSSKQSMQHIGVNELFMIGFTTQNNLYGSLALGFKESVPLANKKLIETIIKQFSLVFEKWETQKALKESEEKFRVAFKTSPDAFIISRISDGIIMEVNDGFYNLTEFKPADVHSKIKKDVHLWKDPKQREIFINSLMRNKVITNFEAKFNSKNKQSITALLSANIINLREEQCILIQARNIEEIKKVEYDLIRAKEKAKESDRLKSAFLANMSHEIRTPMNGIIGFSQLLQEQDVPEDKRNNYLNIIKSNSQSLLNIINDIIDISKIEAGQLNVRKTHVNLNQIMDEMLELSNKEKTNFNKEEIEILLHKDLPDDESMILFDGKRLKQVLTNLLNNALKFTKKGFIQFGYRLVNNERLQFYIRDTGIGMTKEQQQSIFDRFKQVDQGLTRNFGGTGLGLAITKELTELMDGVIRVESKPYQGTVFNLQFPYEKVTDESLNNSKKTDGKNEYPDWKTKKILVVEDDENSVNYIKALLLKTKARLTTKGNAEDAVKLIENNQAFDLILMDIRLPKMNGYQATKLIKEKNQNIPVIAVTAYGMENDRQKILEEGFDNYVAKPVEPSNLLRIIKMYL